MNKKNRKLIRIREAAEILEELPSTVKNRINRKELQVVYGQFKTSPNRVYRAEVEKVAKELGIL